jgi:membrane protease YdiL (CAAX protease family)
MTANDETSGLPAPVGELHPTGAQRSGMENIFMGPSGMRSGWRLLIFIFLMLACLKAEGFTLKHIPGVDAWFKAQDPNVFTPAVAILSESILLLALVISTAVMALIEKRTFADYYLPLNEFLGKRFWQGVPYGFAMLSLALGLIAALHGFTLGNAALSGADALKYGSLYGIAFLMVALVEEGCFRGYMQATLGPGIGFWPAAIVLSILFGAIHLSNLGEAWFGAAMAGSFGILAAFSLQRTGNIWFPIGMHAAWDWSETYFYGVPDSGFLAKGHLFNSSFHGATWLTGGTVGPEGSVFAFLVLVIGGVGIHFIFPKKQLLDS